MDIQIKKVGLEELPLLLEWRIRSIKEVFFLPEDADTTDLYGMNEKYYCTHLTNGSHTAYFAYIGDKIIGCGGICYQDELPSPDNNTGKCSYLMNIYTLPKYRGNGVGGKIIERLIEDAKEHGTKKIYLESSKPAKQFYKKMGFSDMEDYMKL